MNLLNDPLFWALFDTPAPRVILKADTPNFTIVTCNKAYKAATNTQDRDITNMSLWDAFNPDDAGGNGGVLLRDALIKVINTNKAVQMLPFHYDILSADKSKMEVSWWQAEIVPVAGDNAKIAHLLITTYNVTNQIVSQKNINEAVIREQNLTEQLEATNEELASSNEELASTNEELNSTIEELTESQQSLQELNVSLENRVKMRVKDLSESEARFRTMVEQSPVPMLINRGEDLVFDTINQPMLDLIDRDASVIGKPWFEAIPELQGQAVVENLLHTYRTGEAWTGIEVPIVVNRKGKPNLGYYNLTYKALIENGEITGLFQSAIDVTEQVNNRKEIQNSAQKLKSMVMTTPIGMTVLQSRELIVEMANERMLNIWNRELDDVIGNRMIDIFPELDNQPFIDMLVSVIDTGKPVAVSEIEAMISTTSGELKKYYVDFSYDPLFDSDGQVNSLLATVIDITATVEARKQLEISEAEQQALNEELSTTNEELAAVNEEYAATNEELAATNEEIRTTNEELAEARDNLKTSLNELAESEGRMRYMLSEAPVAIAVMTGRELIIESANKMMLAVWGKTPAIIGTPLRLALPELRGQQFLQILDNIYTTGKPYYGNEVKALLEQNGVIEEVYSNFVYYPLKNNEGKTSSIMLVANIVTEQVKARQELQRAEEMLRFSIEAANVGTWFMDVATRKFIPSPRLKELFGFYRDEDVSYEAITAQIPDGYEHKIKAAIEKAISTGGNYSMEHPVIGYHDQKTRWLRGLGKLYPDAEGNLSHFSGLVIDITEQKQDELRKNDFIGMVSHELKTPLTTVTAIVQMLNAKAKKNEDAFTAGALDKANIQVKKMANMINGFLNISRLESGKILVEKQIFNLNDLIKDIVDETMLTVVGHSFTFFPGGPIVVSADRDKIGSVISNLLSNAVKYSPKGSPIQIKCELNGITAHVSVKDQGIGIQANDIEKLFERYYRVQNNNTQHISGFGIGLYLSAEIIKRHDGKIWVESEPGVGSTFYFNLPI